MLDRLENVVMSFEPAKEREKIVHAEVLRSLDTVSNKDDCGSRPSRRVCRPLSGPWS